MWQPDSSINMKASDGCSKAELCVVLSSFCHVGFTNAMYRVAVQLIRTVQKIRNSACSMNSEGNKILKLVVWGIRMFE